MELTQESVLASAVRPALLSAQSDASTLSKRAISSDVL